MTPEILRTGMHHNVRALAERILQSRRAKSRIDNQHRAPGMRLIRIRGDVEGDSFRVERCFEEDYIARLQEGRITVEWQFFKTRESGEEGYHAVAAVVAVRDGDAARVEEGERCVQGGEAGCIGQGVCVQEGGEDGFEAGLGWGCEAGVDWSGVGWGGRLEMLDTLALSYEMMWVLGLGHTLSLSAHGIRVFGSLEYRKVVDRCIGGATSETTLQTSSACRDWVEVPTLCDMVCYVLEVCTERLVKLYHQKAEVPR